MVDGEATKNPEVITKEIEKFYQRLYTETETWRPAGGCRADRRVSIEDNQMLQKEFEEQEIWECVKLCAGDKAPGPDGYTMAFYIHCWEVIKGEVISTIRNFHERCFFEKSFNSTYVALIPKKMGAKELTHFRPISLISSVYKIISKVLTDRLKNVIHKLVDTQQLAFIKGRQIMDAILMANELVDSRVRSNIPGILCKLDIQKAYDHLNWNFLLEALSKRGFGGRWIRWMKFCISTVNFSVLINGSPTGFFSSQRGLRQGDPLSPFLFIIAMESLNDMLKIAQENSWLKGFKASHREGSNLEITHLQYADDTLIFCEASKNQLIILRVIFVLFEAISGLHINWNKSFLYPVNEVPNLTSMAGVLGGSIGELSTVYLGMPLGDQNRSIDIWNGVVEKCEKRLVNWKSQYLSLGGRLTLINSVLDSMPTYMMSLFPIPDGVIERLDVLRRNFLWEGNSETKKFHLVKWDALIGSKQKGGMGVRNLKTQNQCLMMK